MAQALNVVALIGKLASIESAGVAFYESLAKHTKNEKVKKLASTMSRVEKRHQERFEKLAKDMAKKKEADPPDELTKSVQQYLLTLIDHSIFHTPEHAARMAAKIEDENEAVDIAITFEKENILLLLECGAILSGDARKLVKTFIEQEKAHVRSLRRIREQLAKLS